MKKELNINYQLLQFDELSAEDRELVSEAQQMTSASYAPYSHFHVGAALRLANGIVVRGCNQENAVYPDGLCAERVAIFSSQAQYPATPITAIAIAARDTKGEYVTDPVSPCGSCRQVMLEYELRDKHPLRVLLVGQNGIIIFSSAKDLLPLAFTAECFLK
ncbi:MAG: cytidine deaminase [Prevotella sp.]|nr:cytidine deaminase [Candidatus Prevotella equi]